MIHDDLGWLNMAQDAIPGVRGAPGGPGGARGSRLPPTPKRVIKQQNNDSKPWFKVPKVCHDPKGMVSTHFWCIWGHLSALQQRYLLPEGTYVGYPLAKNFIQSFPQPNFTIWLGFLAIFHTPPCTQGVWKIAKSWKNCTGWAVETIV